MLTILCASHAKSWALAFLNFKFPKCVFNIKVIYLWWLYRRSFRACLYSRRLSTPPHTVLWPSPRSSPQCWAGQAGPEPTARSHRKTRPATGNPHLSGGIDMSQLHILLLRQHSYIYIYIITMGDYIRLHGHHSNSTFKTIYLRLWKLVPSWANQLTFYYFELFYG